MQRRPRQSETEPAPVAERPATRPTGEPISADDVDGPSFPLAAPPDPGRVPGPTETD